MSVKIITLDKHSSLLCITTSGLYYKNFTIVIYERTVIGQYYKTMIVAKASPS